MHSGARMSMTSKEEALFTQERILTVSGSAGQCKVCTSLVLAKLAAQEEVPPFLNKGTTYSAPLGASLGLGPAAGYRGGSATGRAPSGTHGSRNRLASLASIVFIG